MLGGVPSCRVTAEVVTASFTRFCLDVTNITVFLASIDEFPFYCVLGSLGVFAFSQSLPEVLYFLIKEFRLNANCSGSVGQGPDHIVLSC